MEVFGNIWHACLEILHCVQDDRVALLNRRRGKVKVMLGCLMRRLILQAENVTVPAPLQLIGERSEGSCSEGPLFTPFHKIIIQVPPFGVRSLN